MARSKALWRFDEVKQEQRPIDAIAAVAELNQSPIEFGTAAALRDAIGFGKWSAGWHCNELTGNLIAAFGTPNLTPVGSPLYGLPGPRGGSDKAIDFDSFTDAFDGGDVYDPALGDLNLAFVTQIGAADADFIGKYAAGNYWFTRTEVTGGQALRFIISDGTQTLYHNIATGVFSVGDWISGLVYFDRVGNGSGLIVKSLATGVVSESVNAGASGLGTIGNAASFTLGSQAIYGAAGTPPISLVAIGALPGSATGMHAGRAAAIANFHAAIMSTPAVVSAAAGRGRSFVALSRHGFEGADVVPGATLATRDATVQAIVKWDLQEQGAAGTWTLMKVAGGDSWSNANASSIQTIAGDGYVEFTAALSYAIISLTADDPDFGYAFMDYAIEVGDTGVLNVLQNGANPFAGTHVAGDVMRIERVGTQITYKKNGIVFYTSLVASSGPLLIDTTFFGNGDYASGIHLVDAGVRRPITWQNLVNVTPTTFDNRGTLYARGKATIAAEYWSARIDLRVVNAAASIGEMRWVWQSVAGPVKYQVGGQFQVPAGYMMLTATRRWVSATKVVLRYYVGATLVNEVESADGDIGGGTTGTTTIGAVFDGVNWINFFDGVIDELRVLDSELQPWQIAATWESFQKSGEYGRMLTALLPPGKVWR